ncbi:hypothetical protein GTA08_BOTSDO11929 [Botryosphaeria dothidea]|uniref:Telomere-associated protein Rif1 N-terminal domain-containing protein n=1 Tax=Botryosphaeria dothidea TaxID=55169 RepID=A0A8H4J4Z4_9PEZI|nr:hypothetical protein GTA08_BOTSDO11929 [Botryosphaeria dothidea]
MAPQSLTVFDDLPLRPPTPPREADKYIDEALQFLSDSFEVEEATGNAPANPEPAFVNTPPQHSPASSAEQANGSSRRKRVDFSPWTAYHSVNDPATSRRGLPGSPLRPLPQPRDPRTLKSILKAHEPPVTQPSTPNPGHHSNMSDDFATMLGGLLKQLDGKSRLHKLDTYMALLNILKTYDGKPDTKALVGKMELMAIYIQRDMRATNSQTGGLDVQLALQALKLLVALMEISPVAARIPDGFRTFFLDKAIETFSDATAPKQWVNHVLHAFYQQRFVRMMNADRANRAITALKDIEDRVSGNNVIICRMLAYQTLLNQQQSVMVSRSSDWIQHVFHGLLSSNKDIRMRAIELSTVAGITVGDLAQISRVTMETLAKEIEEGKNYGDYFTDRLTEMLSNGETAQHVPHIWAAVSLLLRNRRRKLEGWKLLRRWLQVFQKCVNSSNKEVAIQANCAWNRFVYTLKPDHTTSQAFRHLLRQAIVAQFDRKGSDKDAQRMKRSAFSSYCNLLYYSLPPTAPIEQLDLYWQEFVVEVLPCIIRKERKGSTMACKVLTALFKRNQAKLWKENLAVESPMISLENIMALDPRWTRQRLRNVLPPFELCLASAPWTCNSPSDELPSETPVKTMWVALMNTIAEAGSKEVTASMDFKEACAQIMNLFHRIWANYPKSLGQEDDSEHAWIDKFSFLVLSTVEILGPVVLLRKIQDGIAVWVEDPEQKLAGDTADAQGGREAVYTLWEIVMASVEELPRHDTMSLKILEALIVAGLRSRRQRIANRTIEMWNKTFGAQDSLEYPPLVEERLRRIRLVADLRLPEFPESSDNDDEEPIPTFEDSQEDTVQAHPPLEFRGPFPLPKRLNGTASSSPAPSNPTPSRRTQAPSSSSKPKAKLRHDDSQIEFAPIHSSPVGEATLDSQVLTDHQKEVREKQQHAAAMFPDISSSPAKQIKDKRLDLAAYAKPGKYSSLSEDAEPRSTPILNLQEYGGNQDVPSSSPTPRSRRENREDAVSDGPYLTSSAAEAFVETNIPSSPPGLDDENELPADSSIVNETILKNEVSTEAARANHFNTLEEELGEEVVDQLVGDVTNLSDTNLTQFQRASSQISVSSPDSESEMGSSDIEVEVSQQLENEVIAQALRHRDALSNARKQNLLDDATANGNQQALNGDTAGNLLDDLLGDGENISSFDDIAADLPQGTACTGSEPVQKIVLEDLRGTPASPTEKDTSSIDLPIRSSPAKTKSRPETIEQNLAADETVVEDSFVALDATRDASGFQKEPNTQSKQPPPKASRHKKRKSETILDLNNISKRSKKKDSLSSLDVPDAKRSQYTGSESDSDDSLLSSSHYILTVLSVEVEIKKCSNPRENGTSICGTSFLVTKGISKTFRIRRGASSYTVSQEEVWTFPVTDDRT